MDIRNSYHPSVHISPAADSRPIAMSNSSMPVAGQSVAQLRRVLGVMFPPSYIKLYHQPPHSVCSLFNFKQVAPLDAPTTTNSKGNQKSKQVDEQASHLWTASVNVRLEPSTEPSSRAQVLHLQDQLEESLVGHKAKSTGLCPIRRAIYDQCFGK